MQFWLNKQYYWVGSQGKKGEAWRLRDCLFWDATVLIYSLLWQQSRMCEIPHPKHNAPPPPKKKKKKNLPKKRMELVAVGEGGKTAEMVWHGFVTFKGQLVLIGCGDTPVSQTSPVQTAKAPILYIQCILHQKVSLKAILPTFLCCFTFWRNVCVTSFFVVKTHTLLYLANTWWLPPINCNAVRWSLPDWISIMMDYYYCFLNLSFLLFFPPLCFFQVTWQREKTTVWYPSRKAECQPGRWVEQSAIWNVCLWTFFINSFCQSLQSVSQNEHECVSDGRLRGSSSERVRVDWTRGEVHAARGKLSPRSDPRT